MLVQLLRTQISDYWPLIKPHVENHLPPVTDISHADTTQVLYCLMIGIMQCWLFVDKENQDKPLGFVLTAPMNDVTDVKTLLIYNVILLDKTAKVVWEEEYNTLSGFAKSLGCVKLAAFVENQKIISALEKVGADTRHRYVVLNI